MVRDCTGESVWHAARPTLPQIPDRKTRLLLVNLEKSSFSQKLFFVTIQLEIREVWGCPGGGRGAYEDIPSNFLAGSGLTRHQKVNFSTFDGKLEGDFITEWFQIASHIFPKPGTSG